MSELSPCPFCGGEASLREHREKKSNLCRVACLNCGVWASWYSYPAVAIKKWNHRTPPPNTDATPAQGDVARHDTRDTRDTEE